MEADTGKPDKGAVPDSADMPDRDRHEGADTGTLSAGQAAAALGVSERSVRRYITSGRLPATRVHGPKGVEYRITPADVAALAGQQHALDARTVPAGEEADTDRSVAVRGALPAIQALEAALGPIVAELAAAREEREQLRAERADLARRNTHLHELTARQAEEVGRLRAQLDQVKAERIAAGLHATQLIDEARAQEATRPWWAFWRRREGQ